VSPLAALLAAQRHGECDGEKMSKSLGNSHNSMHCSPSGVSSHDLRFFVLQAPYRKPLDFTMTAIAPRRAGRAQPSSWLALKPSLQALLGLDGESVC